jgi:uncharacterized protein (TIRG00374 family)
MDSPENLLKAIKTARLDFLFYAFLCIFAYWVLESIVLKSICHRLSQKLSFHNCLRTTMVGQLFNCLTPFASGGQPMQAVLLTKNNIPIGEASCILLAKFIVYQTTLTFYSFIVVLLKLKFFMKHVSGFGFLVLIGFFVNIIVVALLIGIGFFPNPTKMFLTKMIGLLHKLRIIKNVSKANHKLEEELEGFYVKFTTLKKDLKSLIVPSLITAIQLTAFFIIPYFVCLSLGVTSASIVDIICAGAFVLMLTSFIPLPGGSGGAEGGFYLFFRMFFPKAALLAIAIILWRVFTFYLPIIVGIMFTKLYYHPNEENDVVI